MAFVRVLAAVVALLVLKRLSGLAGLLGRTLIRSVSLKDEWVILSLEIFDDSAVKGTLTSLSTDVTTAGNISFSTTCSSIFFFSDNTCMPSN
jgi:hypothetical protein